MYIIQEENVLHYVTGQAYYRTRHSQIFSSYFYRIKCL